MKTALYPGSFDPATLGHMDIIARVSKLFSRVVVAVLVNPAKNGLFLPEERAELLKSLCKSYPNVEVRMHGGLVAELVKSVGADVIVKGVRDAADFSYETTMAYYNRALTGGVETLFLPADEKFRHISSSAVKELAAHGADIGEYVPAETERALKERFQHG